MRRGPHIAGRNRGRKCFGMMGQIHGTPYERMILCEDRMGGRRWCEGRGKSEFPSWEDIGRQIEKIGMGIKYIDTKIS